MVDEADYIKLGLTCADVCTALDRGLKGKLLNELADSVYETINQLTTSVNLTEMHFTHNLLTMFSIAGSRQRSRGTLSGGVSEKRSPDFSARRRTKR